MSATPTLMGEILDPRSDEDCAYRYAMGYQHTELWTHSSLFIGRCRMWPWITVTLGPDQTDWTPIHMWHPSWMVTRPALLSGGRPL